MLVISVSHVTPERKRQELNRRPLVSWPLEDFLEMGQNQDDIGRVETTVIAVRVSGERRKLPSGVRAQLRRNKASTRRSFPRIPGCLAA